MSALSLLKLAGTMAQSRLTGDWDGAYTALEYEFAARLGEVMKTYHVRVTHHMEIRREAAQPRADADMGVGTMTSQRTTTCRTRRSTSQGTGGSGSG